MEESYTSGGQVMVSGGGQPDAITHSGVKPFLLDCGYKGPLLQSNFAFGAGKSAPLVAFAQKPIDARTACIAVIDANAGSPELVAEYRPLAAPIVLVCSPKGLEWWKQAPERPIREMAPIPARKIAGFFKSHVDDFAPEAIYRAKTWGRFNESHQLSFVDVGLMPLVEQEVGKELERLIVRNVRRLKALLGWESVTDTQGQWLLKTVFWIVSAKILRDKHVPKFESVESGDVDALLATVADHFGATRIPIRTQVQRASLEEIVATVGQFSSLALATTESLAYVYENTLISKSTRQALGTHSTPTYLVDYIVGKLAPWVAELPLERRNVFEPACGHAAFLVSAMRLLTELLPDDKSAPAQRRSYLRSRIHGIERDSFALEIARLSLSLTDVPNPDGWDLLPKDAFVGNELERKSQTATVFLTNPPFENFTAGERSAYSRQGVSLRYVNKAAEVLGRALPALPTDALIGIVVPQGFLHGNNATELRRYLVENFQLEEICLFPDKVFTFSDSESAVLIGRKHTNGNARVRYRRVRERGIEAFRREYRATFDLVVPQARFRETYDLRVPDLEPLWNFCRDWPRLGALAEIGQGFTYKGKNLPKGAITYSDRKFPDAVPGFLKFPDDAQLHGIPPTTWLNLGEEVIRRPLYGATTGVPQIILNEAPTSRGSWRLKAMIDAVGRPLTGRFNIVRPLDAKRTPLEFLWAICNSPIANAYAFSHAGKRHNDAGMLRQIPVPQLTASAVNAVADATSQYLGYVRAYAEQLLAPENPDRACELLLRVDREVLRLYSLPRDLEHQLLRSFDDWPRKGLPFSFDRYFPKGFDEPITLAEFLSITADWAKINKRRAALIEKKVSKRIAENERSELDHLQMLAELRRTLQAPLPIKELENQLRQLARDEVGE